MRFTAMRFVLSTLTTVTVIGATQAVLSADAIRLQSREEERLAKDLQKKHPNPGLHLGWYDKAAKGKPKPDSRPGPDEDGGRLVYPEPRQTPPIAPEPSTLALLATGIGAVAVRSWQRRQKA
jgi:PEP-CTERM motif-containing protein